MLKTIVGGVITVAIGGTVYTISQADIATNFSQETGMTQEEAQKYVDDSKKDLISFDKIGQNLINDSNSIINTSNGIDCVNYRYEWESENLTCSQGKSELYTVGSNAAIMGDCYRSLGTDLGNAARSKIGECITDIDTLNSSFDLPVVRKALDPSQIDNMRKANLYNKSVFRAALESN